MKDARRSSRLGELRLVEPRRLLGLLAIGFGQAAAVAAAALGAAGLAGNLAYSTSAAVGILCAAAAAGACLRAAERVAAERLGRAVVHDLRLRMFRHLLRVSPQFLRQRRRGAAIVRFVGDLQAVRRWVSLGLARLAVSGATALGCLIVLAEVDARLALVLTAVISLAAVGVGLLAAPLGQANRNLRHRRGQLANLVTEQVTALEITQLHGRGSGEQRRLERRSDRLGAALVARARWLGALDAATFVATAAVTLAVMLLAHLAHADPVAQSGTIMAALVAVALLAPSLRDLARVFEYWQAVRVALERLEQFFGWPVQRRPHSAPALADPHGAIEYRGVWLSERVPALSTTIGFGERVALVGPNGIGKSRMLALTAGLVELRGGEVLIGGQSLDAVDVGSLRRSIALVSTDLPLVRGSLRRNLRYHRTAARAGTEAVQRIIDLCALDDVVERLDRGLETRIAEGGRNLSHGERQRIALARALMAEPSILLLDEVDAHLDEKSRSVLERVIREFNGTIIAATHDTRLLGAIHRHIDLLGYAGIGKMPVDSRPAAVGEPA